MEEAQHRHCEGPGDPVELRRGVEAVAEGRGRRQVGDAERPAREVDPVARDQGHQQGKGEGDDDEGMAVGAQGRVADGQRNGCIDQRRPDEAPPEIAAEGHDRERRDIAADAPEAELGKGQQARVAVDEIEGRRRDREDERRDADADDIVRPGQERQRAEKESGDQGGGQGSGAIHPTRMPPRLNRPSGRRNSTTIMITNTAASCQAISKKPPIQFSIRPSPTAATMAPGMLPSPPMMTSAKALKISNWPMYGVTSWMGAMAAPARPHRPAARTTALRATTLGRMPTISAASRFCAMARMARPNCV